MMGGVGGGMDGLRKLMKNVVEATGSTFGPLWVIVPPPLQLRAGNLP